MIAILVLLPGDLAGERLTLAQGWLYNVVKPLPVLRSLHANVRYASAFIFPAAFLGAYVFDRIFKDPKWVNTAPSLLDFPLWSC